MWEMAVGYRHGCNSRPSAYVITVCRYTAIFTSTSVILHLYNSLTAQVCKYIRNNNGVSLNPSFVQNYFLPPRYKSQFDSLAAEPKPLLLISKCHFRTSNEGTLNELYLKFNHYRDIRACGKFQKIWPRWGALSSSLSAERPLTPGAHVSKNTEANF